MPVILTESLDAIKKFFSKKPEDALTIPGEKSFSWAILAGLFVLLTALAFFASVGTLNTEFLRNSRALVRIFDPASARMLTRDIFVARGFAFLSGFILALVQLAGMAGLVKLVFVVKKVEKSFLSTLADVSVATIPLAITAALALIFGWFLPNFSLFLMIIGFIAYLAMVYAAIRKAVEDISVVWTLTMLFAAGLVLLTLATFFAPRFGFGLGTGTGGLGGLLNSLL